VREKDVKGKIEQNVASEKTKRKEETVRQDNTNGANLRQVDGESKRKKREGRRKRHTKWLKIGTVTN